MIFKFCFSFCVLFFLAGCERSIDFELTKQPDKLVVEATIENGQPPIVFLSTSLDYFSSISPDILAKSFVHNASVSISNGSKTMQLKEYTIPINSSYSLSYYSVDSSNLSTAFVGDLNKQYQLKITWQGNEYMASTTIPNISRKIDSLWWIPGVNLKPEQVVVMVKATDPKGFGDYIRYFTKRNREPLYPGMNSVYDDLFIDGTTYQLQVEPGVDRNNPGKEDERYFNKGDTILFKVSNIDKNTFEFWRTMEYSYQSVGNPFSTPIKVLGNISNGALGYFGGYASQYKTLLIPK